MRSLRQAVRCLWGRRLYCSIVVLGLAVGIGANILCFSALYDLLLRPLPYPNAERLVWIGGTFEPGQKESSDVSLSSGELWDLRDMKGVFDGLAAFRLGPSQTAVVGGDPFAVQPIFVTPNLSRVLGVAPSAGSGFEDLPPTSLLLSYEFWQEAFGGSLDTIGRTLVIDGKGFEIAGVMPKRFPLHPFLKPQVWLALDLPRDMAGQRQVAYYFVVGRLSQGVSVEAADAALAVLSPDLARKRPMTEEYRNAFHLDTIPLHERLVGDRRPLLLVFQLGAALLLIIVSMNIANLQLTDWSQRREQFVIRLALGAPRKRILASLLHEGLILAVLGAVLALLLAAWATSLLEALLWGGTQLGQGVLAPRTFATAAATILGVLALTSLLPAIRVVYGISPTESLRREQTSGKRSSKLMNTLVVLQIGCSFVLLMVASVFVSSWHRLNAIDPGFAAQGLVVAKVLTATQDENGYTRRTLYDTIRRRLEGHPAIRSTAVSSSVPIRGSRYSTDFYVETPGKGSQKVSSFYQKVSPGYFQLMGIPLVSGVGPAKDSDRWNPRSVVVNEAFAHHLGGAQAALGRRTQQLSEWKTIVAVVGNTVTSSLNEDPRPIVYGVGTSGSYILIRGERGDENRISGLLRDEVRNIDPLLPVNFLTQDGSLLASELGKERSSALAFGFLGVFGLLVGFGALYGSVSMFVSERTKEIAIRSALGAPPLLVVRPIALRGTLLLGVGIAAGMGGGRLLLHAATVQWPQLAVPEGPHSMFAAVALVIACGVASFFPARRAVMLDPAQTLKGD